MTFRSKVAFFFLLAMSLALPGLAQANVARKQADKQAKPVKLKQVKAAVAKKKVAVAAKKKVHYSAKKKVARHASAAGKSAFRRVAAHEPFKQRLNVAEEAAPQALQLFSNAAVVFNESNGEVLYSKNNVAPMPIASITKLMTAMVVLDAKLPMDELITIDEADVDTLRNTGSRLAVGTTLTRAETMLLALMSSENRAAAALARTYPGGVQAFVARMNRKAQAIGMKNARFYDSTGLNGGNVATAGDLVMLVQAAHDYTEIRQFSTTLSHELVLPNGRRLHYVNTNALVKDDDWQIGLQKTGFINEAGKCVVMQATIANTPLVIVLLDADGKYQRIADANRIKRWLEVGGGARKLLFAKG